MNRLKNEKGAITLLVVVSVLFIISFLITTYIIVSNKLQGQIERSKGIIEVYNNIDEAENIYNNLFSEHTINIENAEQLLKIGSGEVIAINGKMYTFSDNAVYILMRDITFNAGDYTELLDGGDWTPIGSTQYKFDGNGHKITVTKLNGIIKIYSEENEYND